MQQQLLYVTGDIELDGETVKSTSVWHYARAAKAGVKRHLFEATVNHMILPRKFRLIVFIGLQRSGNHAVINWVLSQSRGPCAFFNHVRPHQYPTERHRREFRFNNLKALPTVAFSYEDRDLDDIRQGELQQFMATHVDKIEDKHVCLVLRDVRNMMASRFAKKPHEHESPEAARAVVERWKSYCELAFQEEAGFPGFKLVPAFFDHFLEDADYRDRLSGALEIRRGNVGLDTVTDYGHGSSFSGTETLDKSAVANRWQRFDEDPVFGALLDDATVIDWNARLACLSERPMSDQRKF